ncbi:MAG: hypothetical protein AVDCRST_MAG88-3140 [uncultured Thermomicrobiales bacterium]|uniref:Ricin B lectin domain-containing protein n=1 Tax=uncultured Thermomicrobiales bacterium TaxID=1645740 RepID=A0A6J4VH95_9BACT|nr:MAG: hypothetical protein AVDCRST_MAG88-3140 [uncultured Thermomicrobiales bacterium]
MAAALPAPAPAAAAGVATGREPCYYLQNQLSGHFLQIAKLPQLVDVGNPNFPEGRYVVSARVDAPVVVAPLEGSPAKMTRHATWVRYNGYLVSKLNGFALDLAGDATAPGTPVVVNPGVVSDLPGSRAGDRWDIDAAGVIAERRTGLVLDVKGNSTAPDAPVIAWSRKAAAWGANQRWKLIPLSHEACYPPPPPPPDCTDCSRPKTHVAGGDYAFLYDLGDLRTAATLEAEWYPDNIMLHTNLIMWYYPGKLRSIQLRHYPTVRWPMALVRSLPPLSKSYSLPDMGSTSDIWVSNSWLSPFTWAPEEMYLVIMTDAYPTHERPAMATRFLPFPLPISGEDTNR